MVKPLIVGFLLHKAKLTDTDTVTVNKVKMIKSRESAEHTIEFDTE